MPTLSLCMIIKDEEAYLEGCLQSVQGLVDEIVIVDTGSTDGSLEIAERFGAQVLAFPWTGNFAAARNVSLQAATGDWVLVLDADERLDADSRERLRELLARPEAAGFSLICENRVGSRAASTCQLAPVFRLFRNHLGIHFEGMIHEQAIASAKRTGLETYSSDLRILHLGYMQEAIAQRNKRQRNLSLLQQQVQAEPENPFVHFNLGEALKLLSRPEEAEQHYRRALALLEAKGTSRNISYYANLYFSLGDLLHQRGEHAAAIAILDEAIATYPTFPDLHYIKGHALCELQDARQAIACFEQCLSLAATRHPYPTDPDVTGYKAHLGLADCYIRLGDREAALERLEQSVRQDPNPSADTLTNLGILLLERGESGGAKLRLEEAVTRDATHMRAWLNLGAMHFERAEFEAASEAWDRGLALEPRTLEVRILLAEARIRLGNPETACSLLEQEVDLALEQGRPDIAQSVLDRLDEFGPVLPGLEFKLGSLFARRALSEIAIGCYLRAQQRTPLEPGPYVALGELCLQLGKSADARVMLTRAAELAAGDPRIRKMLETVDHP